MRWLVLGLVTAALLGGAALWVHLGDRRLSALPTQRDAAVEATSQLKSRFRAQHAAARRIDVADFPQSEHPGELIDAASALPQTHRYALDDLRALMRFERSCTGDVPAGPLEKASAFAAFRCGLAAALPPDFFSTPPFMHPSGVSFALLRVQMQPPGTAPHALLAAVHHLELRGLTAPLPEPLAFFAALSSEEALGMARGYATILTDSHVLFREDRNATEGQAPRYAVHDRALFARFIAQDGWAAERVTDVEKCRAAEGNVCFLPDGAGAHTRAQAVAVLASSSVGVLVILVAAITLAWTRARARMRETRALILKTLTHELRTPATGLTLSLESLRPDFDRLSPSAQDAFLRMCDDVNRLRRVIQASTRYLSAESVLAVERRHIESVRELLEDVLQAHADCALVVERNGPFTSDPYWLGTCVQNLVENAKSHGRAPVTVRLRVDDDALLIAVSDAGTGPTLPLRSLRRAFVRGDHSAGLGLGLHLVDTIMRSLDGTLTLSRQPTTFSLTLRRMR